MKKKSTTLTTRKLSTINRITRAKKSTSQTRKDQKQGRITNRAGITMVRAAARRRSRVAKAAILDAQFSRMLAIRGA